MTSPMRNRRGVARTDFGARWARPRGWITVVNGSPGVMWCDEVASLTPEAWERMARVLDSEASAVRRQLEDSETLKSMPRFR